MSTLLKRWTRRRRLIREVDETSNDLLSKLMSAEIFRQEKQSLDKELSRIEQNITTYYPSNGMSERRLSNWIDGFMAFTESLETPYRYREWTALSVVASALQRKCFTTWGANTFFPNMFVVLVGPSGIRKGTAMAPGKYFLRKMGIHMAAESATREALIRSMVSAVREDQVLGETIRHCSMTIYSSELTVFLGYNNPQLMTDLTNWYDCEDLWTYETVGRGEETIAGVWVNLLGATTPQAIRGALPPGFIGGGLTSRMLFIYEEEKTEPRPFPFLSERQEEIEKDLLHDISSIVEMSGRFTYDIDFMTKWGDWYVEQYYTPPMNDPNFEGYNNRRGMHLMKLCIILSASTRSDMVIDGDVFDLALDTLERAETGMTKTFSGYGQSSTGEVLKKLMRFIAQRGTVTEAEILKNFFGDISDRKHLYAMLEVMKRMEFCTISGTEITVNQNFKAQ